jgi:dimeric dUTPase (all-alpha-NTP-PPase superfamily)
MLNKILNGWKLMKKDLHQEEILKLQKELALLQSEIRYLKYMWDLKEIEERGKESHTTVYVEK